MGHYPKKVVAKPLLVGQKWVMMKNSNLTSTYYLLENLQKMCYKSIILDLWRYSSDECTGQTWPFELPGVTDTCDEAA